MCIYIYTYCSICAHTHYSTAIFVCKCTFIYFNIVKALAELVVKMFLNDIQMNWQQWFLAAEFLSRPQAATNITWISNRYLASMYCCKPLRHWNNHVQHPQFCPHSSTMLSAAAACCVCSHMSWGHREGSLTEVCKVCQVKQQAFLMF